MEKFTVAMNRRPIIFLLFFVLLFVSPSWVEAVCISGDCQNGYGIFSWANGDEHEGYFKGGQANGQGTRKYWDGDKYVGEYKDGKKHGYGTYYWFNGDRFAGEYKDGKRNGHGTKTYADGSIWIGEWSNDKRVWQPKKNCDELAEYSDEGLYKDFEKVFDRQGLFNEANESLNKIKKDLISDTKTWSRLAGTNDWSVVVRTISQRLKTTTNLVANLANIDPRTGLPTSVASADADTEMTFLYVYRALLENEPIQSVSVNELKIAYENLILSVSGGLRQTIRVVWDLAEDIKDGVYRSENHEQLKVDMDKALNNLSRDFALLERKITAAKKRAYVIDDIKKGIDRYCNN